LALNIPVSGITTDKNIENQPALRQGGIGSVSEKRILYANSEPHSL
jgi:hypothetical protein